MLHLGGSLVSVYPQGLGVYFCPVQNQLVYYSFSVRFQGIDIMKYLVHAQTGISLLPPEVFYFLLQSSSMLTVENVYVAA